MVQKNITLVNIIIAIIALMFVCLWIPLEIGAQSQPEPTPECVTVDGTLLCISHIAATLTPFVPTSTPVPPTVAPTATSTIQIQPFARTVYLALILR